MKEIILTGQERIPEYFTGKAIWEDHLEYDGDIDYWLDGKEHRIDGPALISAEGYTAFYIRGSYFYKKEDWFKALSEDEKLEALWNIEEWNNL